MLLITQGKTDIKYIIIILILVLIAGGGILWRERVTQEEMEKLGAFSEIERPLKATTGIADWNVYENKEAGFAFRYPSSKFQCGSPHSWGVCLTGDYSGEISIFTAGYGPEGEIFTCGADFLACVKGEKEIYYNTITSYSKRTIPYGEGIEIRGIFHTGEERRTFMVEDKKKGTFIFIRQRIFSPEVDQLYNQILYTLRVP